jgi:hypothetical protein
MTRLKLLLNFRQRFVLFVSIAIIGFLIAGFAGSLIIMKFGADSTPAMRIASVIQSIFQLILPALLTAMLVTRMPADFLRLRAGFSVGILVWAFVILMVSTPAMNYIIELNNNMSLPQSMSGLEDWFRRSEDNAARSLTVLQGEHNIINLIVSILIMGLLAGFGEELFFRGAFQRLLTTGGVNRHLAVWSVAFVFSAIHFQFYGFVPRLLLGAYLGYLLVWSKSLWLPIAIHALNNTLYVILHWDYRDAATQPLSDGIGAGSSWPYAVVSAVITAVAIIYFRKYCLETENHLD